MLHEHIMLDCLKSLTSYPSYFFKEKDYIGRCFTQQLMSFKSSRSCYGTAL